MNEIRNIIFDFDGTLADTSPLIIATMQATIGQLGLASRTEAECKATIGVRLEDVPAILWPGDARAAERYAATYRQIFNQLKLSRPVDCFPGVVSTLGYLYESGYRMAIASSRSHKSLDEYVQQLGHPEYFDLLIGGDDVVHGKPSPEPVQAILDRLGWDASATLTVGDAPVDILMGRAAGTATCAVTYGNGTVEELREAGPDYLIQSFEALIPLVSGVS